MSFSAPKWYMEEWSETPGMSALTSDPVPVHPRWWYTTDEPTLARITFLPDYEPRDGEMVIVGMRAVWDGGDMDLVCDRLTGDYFKRSRAHDENRTIYGKVFAPAPPPVGLWTGEHP